MAGDGELTALAASGIAPAVVARPVLAAAAVVSLAALLLMDTLAPFAASQLRLARRDIIHQLHTAMRAGKSDLKLGRGRISFESFDGSSFKDVCVEWRQGDRVHLYRARTGAIAITDWTPGAVPLSDAERDAFFWPPPCGIVTTPWSTTRNTRK